MSYYRKKSHVIEAFKWTGGPDQTEDPEWIIEAIRSGIVWFESGYMVIDTLEGNMIANQGDWIIRGINGELYPCKPDIFERTYDAVE